MEFLSLEGLLQALTHSFADKSFVQKKRMMMHKEGARKSGKCLMQLQAWPGCLAGARALVSCGCWQGEDFCLAPLQIAAEGMQPRL
jgi:hypothetical protein